MKVKEEFSTIKSIPKEYMTTKPTLQRITIGNALDGREINTCKRLQEGKINDAESLIK